MISAEQDFDCDVVYVDFDELFHGEDMEIRPQTGYVDDGHLIAHYMSENGSVSESDMVQAYNSNTAISGRSGPKPMTKEQFYKIRPKMPRINKSDPRRNYAAAYADAYNSCDFDVIWNFLNEHCVKDFTFIQKWVGAEQYLNFPLHLEIKGVDAAAEYWFSRCLLAPDLALSLKVTKLFVRSDGLSTVASSFIILCTRLFDGELSDSLIRTVASQPSITDATSSTVTSDASTMSNDSADEKLDVICNRAIEKVDRILLQSAPAHDPNFSLKRKRKRHDSMDSDGDSQSESQTPRPHMNHHHSNGRKRMPKDKTITLLGNVTMSVNEDKKIYRMEVSFALQQDEK